MKLVEMWQAYDGKTFETKDECVLHERSLAAGVLDPYVLAFNIEGKQISWADYNECAYFALVKKVPTNDEFDNNDALDQAWADHLDADLDGMFRELKRAGKSCEGWWLRDPWSEYWHPWEQAHKTFNDLIETLLEVQHEYKN